MACAAAAVGLSAGSESPASSAERAAPAKGAILFSGGPAGSGAYAVDARGGALKRVATATLEYPQWASDGRRLAFLHYNDSSGAGPDLYVTRPDGTHPKRITSTRADKFAWSPEGTEIVLRDTRAVDSTSGAGLAIVDVSTGTTRRLTSPAAMTWDSSPTWSPDGGRIAFLRRHQSSSAQCGGAGCAFVVAAEGRSAARLVAAKAYSLAWSPNGAGLAVAGAGEAGGVTVVRIGSRSAGSLRAVARGTWAVSWSPDGRSIALTGWLAGERSGTFLMRPDGSGFRQLSTHGTGFTSGPSWSPDSRSLAVLDNPASGQSVNEIWAVDAGGRGAWRVTRAWRSGYDVWSPQWNPKGLTTAQLAGTAVSHAIPPQSVATGNALRAPGRVAQLVADGPRVALDIRDTRLPAVDSLELWAPAGGALVRFGGQYGSGYPSFALPFNELALGGTRVALGAFGTGGGPVRYWVDTATAAIPRMVRASGPCPSPEGMCFSTPLADAMGDGSLIVFDRWACPGLTERRLCGSPKQNGELWRLDGTSAVRIASAATALTPLAVDAGRILVDHEDGTLALLRADGSPIRTFTVDRALIGAALQGRDLVVQTATGIDVADAESGAFQRRLPLPAESARLADLQGGIAVLTAGADVHLLRLSDGRSSVIHTASTTPVLAQLEPSGLFYATTVDAAAYPGRVVHVPWSRLPLGS